MQEKELMLPQGSLYYELHDTAKGVGAVITKSSGMISRLEIPDSIEGYPVTGIGRKAFLSRKQLKNVMLPETVEELGDWAFAYCSSLEEIHLPCRELTVGRAPFLDCSELKKVEITGKDEQTAVLVAAAVRVFDAYYLFDPLHAGSREWLGKWDARLLAFLHADDQEGYSRQVLCGEEDYGSTDLEAYLRNQRKAKVRLCFLRLLNDRGLSEKLRHTLEQYLLAHTKGKDSEETWLVVLHEHGEDRSYYELFAKLGCVTEENFDGILGQIGEESPEMKAFFLRYKEESMGYCDFFDQLSLDF